MSEHLERAVKLYAQHLANIAAHAQRIEREREAEASHDQIVNETAARSAAAYPPDNGGT